MSTVAIDFASAINFKAIEDLPLEQLERLANMLDQCSDTKSVAFYNHEDVRKRFCNSSVGAELKYRGMYFWETDVTDMMYSDFVDELESAPELYSVTPKDDGTPDFEKEFDDFYAANLYNALEDLIFAKCYHEKPYGSY